MIVRLLAVAFTLASAVAQQRTLVVDQTAGPYTQISAAIAAARPGDRIEVHPGNYDGFLVTFGLDIVAPSGGVSVSPGVSIQNIPAANAVRIDGISVNSLPAFSIGNCAGIVHLHQVTAGSISTILSSPRVAISRSSLTCSSLYPGLWLRNSSVVLDSCSIHGGRGSDPTYAYPYPGDGAPGLNLEQSHAFLTDCTVVGGNGASGYPITLRNGFGANGAIGDSTSSLLAVGTGSITGGNGIGSGFAFGIWFPPNSVPNSVHLGPGVMASGVPVIAIAEPPHVIAPLTLPSGTIVAIQATNTANQAVLLGIDLWNDLIRIPGVELPFVLTPAASLYAFAPPTAASTAQFALAVPQAQWLLNQFVHLQAVTVDSAGTLQFSSGGYGRIN